MQPLISNLSVVETFDQISLFSAQIQYLTNLEYGYCEKTLRHSFFAMAKVLNHFEYQFPPVSKNCFVTTNLRRFVATVISTRGIPFIHLYALVSTLPNIYKIRQLSVPDEPVTALEISLALSEVEYTQLTPKLFQFGQETLIDVALQLDEPYRRHKRLIVFDMDSTLIRQEVIDELAREAGVYDKIAPITESAMRGEIDFNESLRQRVGLLKDQPSQIIDTVKGRISFTDGAVELCRILKHLGYKMAVLSDYAFANNLEHTQDKSKLTGKVNGPIVNGERKAELLTVIAQAEGIMKQQIFAVGDGANDLLMLAEAGVGIAFNAKPKVQQQAKVRLNQPNLLNILYLLGLDWSEIATFNKET
ncbi:hypothetical protein HK103_005402 [Boothiomyces macroporosus]|uniref:phosphoserine phosphatase n=1 Tax=Boothiomyces macroporosus TaxID=261099 RepID=A0AAD5Y872_9FUNG|nr:hypothetical protein HK103_005402 [Boothiomyces macroporosus]